ncbi:MAG: hypothetical protein CR982_00020 [Candidatus Cloacimonadota bacterium]|nr:MAG: hypothetical protein CR982_00020 [Candidatus Cloacimonadota bacterium]PIE78343.1 MAG: hypothetical protein CSA15_08380 [Candidatus Delongbacteria bacterium]
MNKLYAKGEPEWTELKKHLFDVVHLAHLFLKYLPNLESLTNLEDEINDIAILSALFHDMGKACSGFQKQLKSNKKWGYRHEIISVSILDGLEYKHKDIISRVILSHHKDFQYFTKNFSSLDEERDDIIGNIFGIEKSDENEDIERFNKELKSIDIEFLNSIQDILNHLYDEHYLNNRYNYTPKLSKQHPVKEYIIPFSNENSFPEILLRGLLIASDHFASAGIKEIPFIDYKYFSFLDRFKLREHQLKSKESKGNSILIAPTGSGKTESSIAWAKKYFKTGETTHLFYILPFTASINSMYERFSDIFGIENTGLLHSKALNSLIQIHNENEKITIEDAKTIKEQSKKLLFPIIISTPWQLIQYFFSIKFYETGLLLMSDALFIVDEIHCYDAKSMGMFLGMIHYISKKLGSNIFIMSATIPKVLREKIENSFLSKPNLIKVDKKILSKQCRHKINIISGSIKDYTEEIKNKIKSGKRIIVVANSIKSAINIFEKFENVENKVLIHGKFIAKDRAEKEKLVKDRELLVGTQAIEVSLDIDYDEMYTEPAPLDALLQRFGRVNRKGEKGISDIFVLSNIDDATKFIYDQHITEKTIETLRGIDLLSEDIVEPLIDKVYNKLNDNYEKIFNETYNSFIEMTDLIKAYKWDDEAKDKFHKLFDGIEVIPYSFYDTCSNLIDQNRFMEISNYTITISNKQFYKYKDIIHREEFKRGLSYYFIDMKYQSDLGLIETTKNDPLFM